MARLPRYFVEGQPQSIVHGSKDNQPVLTTEDDYYVYYESLLNAAERYGLAVHAYILTSNHVHLLATPKDADTLPRTLQSVGRRYGQYFNNTYGHTGALWEGRYRATIIDSKEYLLTCMRYIELVPVRSGLAKHPRDYLWSSYHANANGEPDELISTHPIYRKLARNADDRHKAYRTPFRNRIPKHELRLIEESTYKGWVLGNEQFRSKIERLSGRPASPRPKGRPKKMAG